MWWEIGSMALSVLSAGAGSSANAASAKAQEKWQAYKNAMARISNAQNQNAITDNTVSQIQQSARVAMGIQKQGMQVMGASEVQAAASGTAGNSVRATERDLERTTMGAEMNRRQTLQDVFASERNQRQASEMSAAMGQDYSYIPKPSSASSMLGLGAGIMNKFGPDIGKWMGNLNFGGGAGAGGGDASGIYQNLGTTSNDFWNFNGITGG